MFVVQVSIDAQAAQQLSNDSLAASCDRTHLYVIWGLTPLPSPLAPATAPLSEPNISRTQSAGNAQHGSRAAQRGSAASQADFSSFSRTDASASAESAQTAAAENTDHNLTDRDSVLRHGDYRGLTGPDDLVASLRRLRPHLHASGPFTAQSAAFTQAEGASAASGQSSFCVITSLAGHGPSLLNSQICSRLSSCQEPCVCRG